MSRIIFKSWCLSWVIWVAGSKACGGSKNRPATYMFFRNQIAIVPLLLKRWNNWSEFRLFLLKNSTEYNFIFRMIGAMPAVAVRHERRKGQEKRSKRPSQLYIGGYWLPPNSPSPTPSNGPYDDSDRLPEFYICGKVIVFEYQCF